MSSPRTAPKNTLPPFDPINGSFDPPQNRAVQVSTLDEFHEARLDGHPMVIIDQIEVPGTINLVDVCIYGCNLLRFPDDVTLHGSCSIKGASFRRVNILDEESAAILSGCTLDGVMQVDSSLVLHRCKFRKAKMSIESIGPKKLHVYQCFFDAPHFLCNITKGRAHFTNCVASGVSGRFFSITDGDLYSCGNTWIAGPPKPGLLARIGLSKPKMDVDFADQASLVETMDDTFMFTKPFIRTKHVRRPNWVLPYTIPSAELEAELARAWAACPQ